MNKLMLMGGAVALAAGVGCTAKTCCLAKGPAFEDVKWETTAFDSGVWTIDKDGVMTASKDNAIWSATDYEDFILDFDYKLDPGANSGVVIYAIDTANWIPGSIEIQLLDDNHERWKKDPPRLQNSSLYGHLGPKATPAKPAGEWNHMTVTAKGQKIKVAVNGVETIDADISVWTDAKKNPDGSDIPPWLSTPWAEIPTTGRIGFQGMHGGAKPYFRNVRVAKIPGLLPYTDGATARTAAYRVARAAAEKIENAPVLAIASVTGDASGFSKAEAPEMAFVAEKGKKLCCDWKGKLTLQATLKEPATVASYTVASGNDYAGRDPKAWELYASENGTDWTLVDTQKDISFARRNDIKLFTLAKPVKAAAFKLVVTAHHGEEKVQFSRVTFRK